MVNYESVFTFDERRKELKASKVWTMRGEEEIKQMLSDLSSQRTRYEQEIKRLKDAIKEKPLMTEDLNVLKEQLTRLQLIDVTEKQEKQLEQHEEALKGVKTEIEKVKGAIGSRLKL
jgi:hypothetical protein